jgi:hypothetical protein
MTPKLQTIGPWQCLERLGEKEEMQSCGEPQRPAAPERSP